MRLRRTFVASCLLSAALVGMPAGAVAQATTNQGGVTADGVVVPPATSAETGLTPTTPASDDAQPINPEIVQPPAETSPVPAGSTPADATPTPPGYLAPGAYASVQPVSGVADLRSPDVPPEPIRIASLVAALIAALLVAAAVTARTLGLRTAVRPPVATAPGGRLSRTRDAFVLLADDVRDFLRHSR